MRQNSVVPSSRHPWANALTTTIARSQGQSNIFLIQNCEVGFTSAVYPSTSCSSTKQRKQDTITEWTCASSSTGGCAPEWPWIQQTDQSKLWCVVHTGMLHWEPQVNKKIALVMISIWILEQVYYSDISYLNPTIYMLINFSLKSQRNASLTFCEKHFIKPQCNFIQCHSYEIQIC